MGDSLFLALFTTVVAVIGAGQVYVGLRGIGEMRERGRIRERALPVTARVTASDTVVGRDSDGDTVRTVLTTVQFEDREERTHTVQVSLPRLTRPPRPGTTVDVVYDPLDPATVLPAGRGGEGFATGVAGLFVVVGAGLLTGAGVLLLSLLGLVDLSGVFGGLFDPSSGEPAIELPDVDPAAP